MGLMWFDGFDVVRRVGCGWKSWMQIASCKQCGFASMMRPSRKNNNIKNIMQDTQNQDIANQNLEIATLGGGCFWCTETVYQDLRGVLRVESGYMGGHVKNPTYREICSATTGHAEVIQVTFDPSIISYQQILEVFFTIHDPTTLNRQGNDVGPQYRSVVFYHSEDQKALAMSVKSASQAIWDEPIVTEIAEAAIFYKAEAYHQNYYKNNPYQGYCSVVITPKVAKFKKQWVGLLR
jgi:peptide-methionine (S)-S-oxide reductase